MNETRVRAVTVFGSLHKIPQYVWGLVSEFGWASVYSFGWHWRCGVGFVSLLLDGSRGRSIMLKGGIGSYKRLMSMDLGKEAPWKQW